MIATGTEFSDFVIAQACGPKRLPVLGRRHHSMSRNQLSDPWVARKSRSKTKIRGGGETDITSHCKGDQYISNFDAAQQSKTLTKFW